MTDMPTEILLQLVRARYSCLVQLRDLGRRQMELIDEGNVTALLDVLSVKQKPLSDIQRIEKASILIESRIPSVGCGARLRIASLRAACAEM